MRIGIEVEVGNFQRGEEENAGDAEKSLKSFLLRVPRVFSPLRVE
jgi:hypothetical protein